MLDLKTSSCSMLVPRCLKQALSELQPFKAIGISMGGMQRMAKFLSEWMHVYCFIWLSWYSEASKKTTVGDQINTVSKTNKHRTRWSEHKTAFLVHSQQRITGALLSASELSGGSARPSDGNSSYDVTQPNTSFSTGRASLSNLPAVWLKTCAERMHWTCNVRRISPGKCHKNHTHPRWMIRGCFNHKPGCFNPEAHTSSLRKSTAREYELDCTRAVVRVITAAIETLGALLRLCTRANSAGR